MKKFTITIAGLLAMGALVLQLRSPQPAKAQDNPTGCSTSTIKGNYGFTMLGFAGPVGGMVPVATGGRLTFDGGGNLTGSSTNSLNGTMSEPQTLSGGYTISPGCTGTAWFTPMGPGAGTVHVALVVLGNGRQIDSLETDTGTTVTGSANLIGEGQHN
jgi:hypothetical protein